MEPTDDTETSADFKRTPGIYPKEHIQYSKPDESLKSRYLHFFICGELKSRGSVVTGTTWRHIRLESYHSVHAQSGHQMVMKYKLHAPSTVLLEDLHHSHLPVSTERVGWPSELICTLMRRKISLVPAWNWKQILSFIILNIFRPISLRYSLTMKRQLGLLFRDQCVQIKWVSVRIDLL